MFIVRVALNSCFGNRVPRRCVRRAGRIDGVFRSVLLGEQSASKTDGPGSNPGGPAEKMFRCGRAAMQLFCKQPHGGSNPSAGLNENGDQISPRLFKPGAQRLATKPTPSECAGVA